MKIIIRIIGFPFFMCLAFIGAMSLFVKYCYNYLSHGGEAIAYTMKNERKMIKDVYEVLLEIKNNGTTR